MLKEAAANLVDLVQMEDLEIWRTAGGLVAQLGAEQAVFQAANLADRSRAENDAAGARDWLLVLDAIEELVRPAGTCEYVN